MVINAQLTEEKSLNYISINYFVAQRKITMWKQQFRCNHCCATKHTDTPLPEDAAELIKEFKSVYRVKGKNDLLSQVPFLSKLAKIYVKRSRTSSLRWLDLVKVNASLVITAEKATLFMLKLLALL